jgi:hypothetical protein
MKPVRPPDEIFELLKVVVRSTETCHKMTFHMLVTHLPSVVEAAL